MSEVYRRGMGLPYNAARLEVEVGGGFAPKKMDRRNGLEEIEPCDVDRLSRLEAFSRLVITSDAMTEAYVHTTLELEELDELQKISEAYPFAAPLVASETELTLV